MKLIFSRGEHAPVVLTEGVTRIGSAADCEVRVDAAGIAAHHCEIAVEGDVVTLTALGPDVATVLNGRQIAGPTELTVGDLVLFGRIGCSVVAAGTSSEPVGQAQNGPITESGGRTVVRMALPKFMLRGVSGTTFGKTFVMTGSMIMGRQSDCDIAVPADEVSRKHARLTVQADGVAVEDLGSANGTFINDKRVQTGTLRPGDELRLDSVRFQLSTPGMVAAAVQSPVASSGPAVATAVEKASGGNFALWLSVGIIVAASIAVAVLHYAGYL